MKRGQSRPQVREGFTLVELVVSLFVLAIVGVAVVQLFIVLLNTTTLMKRRAIALEYSTNRMEHYRSLPYDSIVVGESSTTEMRGQYPYEVKTIIKYVDDFGETRGCLDYGTDEAMQALCRGWSKDKDPYPGNNVKRSDENPRDYKVVRVEVRGREGILLSSADTYIAARVAETAAGTAAIMVRVIDGAGNPVEGALVTCQNGTVTPVQTEANCRGITDASGYVVFYDLPPDEDPDYVLTASKEGYSKIWTIPATNKLTPTYPNLALIPQKLSKATLVIKPKSSEGLLIEAIYPDGTPIPNLQIAIKGGYKKYIDADNNDYYYQYGKNAATRPVTDANGYAMVNVVDDDTAATGQGLTPGDYFFCDDFSNNACKGSGGSGSSHILIAAMAFNGDSPFSPATIPQKPADTTVVPQFEYNGQKFIQKVRLIMMSNNSAPTIISMKGANVKLSSLTEAEKAEVPFTLQGDKLSSLGAVQLLQNSLVSPGTVKTYPVTCSNKGDCVVDLRGAEPGIAHLEYTSGSNILRYVAPRIGDKEPLGGLLLSE